MTVDTPLGFLVIFIGGIAAMVLVFFYAPFVIGQ
jgi:hypothetical protein